MTDARWRGPGVRVVASKRSPTSFLPQWTSGVSEREVVDVPCILPGIRWGTIGCASGCAPDGRVDRHPDRGIRVWGWGWVRPRVKSRVKSRTSSQI
jgi:hypothetical protein